MSPVIEHRGKQLVAMLEMPVETASGDPELLGQRIHANAEYAAGGQGRKARLQPVRSGNAAGFLDG
jgi:hypothetical protein